ncbi:tyrosine-protein phosphatase [Staphylococcus hyicus]|uniref:tyrosine-protein phosphatase n=1 Tax=Staphylococcus hyicus TaxID=1284 RepID=UPI0036D2AE3F
MTVDIHAHVLFGIDDGPKTVEDQLQLLRQAEQDGITDIIATPHHLHPMFDNTFLEIEPQVKALNERLINENINIHIYPGQEVRINDQFLKALDEGLIQGLNHTKYLLIEFPSNQIPNYTQDLFYELKIQSYVPIIAHPERNKIIIEDLSLLYDFVEAGALSQVTVGALTGKHGKNIQKAAITIVDNHLAHFIASDAHHVERRPFNYRTLQDAKLHQSTLERIEQLQHNARHVLNGEEIEKLQPEMNFKKKKWFGLF